MNDVTFDSPKPELKHSKVWSRWYWFCLFIALSPLLALGIAVFLWLFPSIPGCTSLDAGKELVCNIYLFIPFGWLVTVPLGYGLAVIGMFLRFILSRIYK